ncbi:MAG: hypothetical protein GY870_01605, partial [archaeon]|nr:hypothetical protein [archaeon]
MAKGKTKKGENLLIQHILSRFFESQYKTEDFSTLKELLDLPITALKDVDKIEAAQVHEIFKVNTIDDLSKLNPINPIEDLFPTEPMDNEKFEKVCKKIIDNTLEAIPDFEAFRNHIAVAKMVERAWSKRTTYNRKKDTKVICVGLDNAGKTAILTGLGGKLGINELSKLKPTKKIERRKISTDSLDLHVWDLGGQKDYRRGYLEKPEVYFIGTDLLIYVIDIQDPERFNESFEYLIEIMDVVKILGENPYILGFMHKSDPDILDDPDFQLNTEYVADKMNYHLRNYEYEYDIYTTSIYNFFTSEPKFSRFIKETLSDKESLNNPVVRKIEGMGDILDSTLNAVVTLASSMGEQIAQLGRRIDELEVKIERTFMPLPKT